MNPLTNGQMSESEKGKLRFILGFSVFFVALWLLWDTPAVYPLKIFVVLLHEASHAIAVVVSGGTLDRITLDPRQGGATYFSNGNAILALSAGYLGSLAWGGLMFSAARTKWIRTDWMNGLIGGLVVLLTVFYVRGAFGITFGVLFGLAMITASRKIGPAMNRHLLVTLGLTSALYAVLDIKSDILDRPELQSDAHMLAEATGIGTTTMWGAIWITIAVAFCAWLLRWAYREA